MFAVETIMTMGGFRFFSSNFLEEKLIENGYVCGIITFNNQHTLDERMIPQKRYLFYGFIELLTSYYITITIVFAIFHRSNNESNDFP